MNTKKPCAAKKQANAQGLLEIRKIEGNDQTNTISKMTNNKKSTSVMAAQVCLSINACSHLTCICLNHLMKASGRWNVHVPRLKEKDALRHRKASCYCLLCLRIFERKLVNRKRASVV
jgi:hypothetical protein